MRYCVLVVFLFSLLGQPHRAQSRPSRKNSITTAAAPSGWQFRRLGAYNFADSASACVGAAVGLGGSHSLYAGVTQFEADLLGWASSGYGNNWDQTIERAFDYTGGSVTLEYDIVYDTEPGYDFVQVVVDPSAGGGSMVVATYDGQGSAHGNINLTPGVELPMSPSQVRIGFRVVSDGGFSPEDGLWAAPCGAAAVDNVALSGGLNYFQDFENDAMGWAAKTGQSEFSGVVFNDLDGDGNHDGGEPGLSGWDVQLETPSGFYYRATSGAGGAWWTSVPDDDYTITEVTQSGWLLTAPPGGEHFFASTVGGVFPGIDFGNFACTSGGCVDVPSSVVAWWPLDELSGNTAHDIARGHDATYQETPTPVSDAYVSNALRILNDDPYADEYVSAPKHDDFATNGTYAFECWMYWENQLSHCVDCGQTYFSAGGERSMTAGFLPNGLHLHMKGTNMVDRFDAGEILPEVTWKHIAFSVSGGIADIYIDGQPAVNSPAFAYGPYPRAASGMNIGGPGGFAGIIDEFTYYGKTLSADQVQDIYQAGPWGKCKEEAYLPWDKSFCKNDDVTTLVLSVCNDAPVSHTYRWSVSGLPAGTVTTMGTSDIDGPEFYSPAAGNLVVGASRCRSVAIVVTRPAGMNANNLVGMVEAQVRNLDTGNCFSVIGSVQDHRDLCVDGGGGTVYVDTGLVAIPATVAVDIGFVVRNTGGLPSSINYEVQAVAAKDTVSGVSLNSMSPGVPVIGNVNVPPGDSATVTVSVAYPEHIPFGTHDLLFITDVDNDGNDEVQTSVGVRPLTPVVTPLPDSCDVDFTMIDLDLVQVSPGVYDITPTVSIAMRKGSSATVPLKYSLRVDDALVAADSSHTATLTGDCTGGSCGGSCEITIDGPAAGTCVAQQDTCFCVVQVQLPPLTGIAISESSVSHFMIDPANEVEECSEANNELHIGPPGNTSTIPTVTTLGAILLVLLMMATAVALMRRRSAT